jgi:hypothetical protein
MAEPAFLRPQVYTQGLFRGFKAGGVVLARVVFCRAVRGGDKVDDAVIQVADRGPR